MRAYVCVIVCLCAVCVCVYVCVCVCVRVRARVYMRADVYGYISFTTTVASDSVSIRYATFEFVCQDVGQSLACA